MRYLVVANPKGGQAKTTTALNIAFALAEERMGYRVALVDLDPKNDLSDYFGVDAFDEEKPTVGEVLTLDEDARVSPLDALMPVGERVDLLPSTMYLEMVGSSLYNLGEERTLEHLKSRLSPLEATHDWVVVDTAGATGPLPMSAFGAADELIVAVNPQQEQGVRGLLILDHVLGGMVERGKLNAHITEVLFTQVEDRIKEVGMNIARVMEAGYPIAPSRVLKSVELIRAEGHGRPIIELAPDAQSSCAYRYVAQSVQKRDQVRVTKSVTEEAIA